MPENKEILLSKKEEHLRNFILNDSMFKVILRIGLPIAFFQSLNTLFRVVDSFMAASIDATSVATVLYFGQINLIINGLGLGLATGATLKISQMYGKGNYETVKKQISSLLVFAVICCIILIIVMVPLATPLLRFINTPEEFVTLGRNYFLIEFGATMLMILNGIYIALERVQGNSKRILKMNLVAMVMRLSFTAFSVYILNQGVIFIAISTILSQGFIFAVGLYQLSGRSEVFTISFKDVTFKKEVLLPMIIISLPIMVERSAFHVGKTVVNTMITALGPLVVGGLGISNLICGISVAPQAGFQDASIAVMAQNMGANKYKRVIEAFKAVLIINLVQAIVFFIPSLIFARQLTNLFAIGDPVFHDIVYSVFSYEVLGIIPLGVYSAIMALLFGLGYTKWTLLLNFCRIFLFRIPVLWYLQNFTNMGEEAAGVVMTFSNVAVTCLGVIMGINFIVKLCKEHDILFWKAA